MTDFADAESRPRIDPPPLGDERAVLSGFLRWQRDTLRIKCAGLGPEALARRAVVPSALSLLGLVRHLADAERDWFRRIMAGQQAPPIFYSTDHPNGDFDGAAPDPDLVAEAARAWAEEVEFAERFVREAPDLDLASAVAHRELGQVSLRWVVVHMIEEYARHAGHADLLRERIDGTVGE